MHAAKFTSFYAFDDQDISNDICFPGLYIIRVTFGWIL